MAITVFVVAITVPKFLRVSRPVGSPVATRAIQEYAADEGKGCYPGMADDHPTATAHVLRNKSVIWGRADGIRDL